MQGAPTSEVIMTPYRKHCPSPDTELKEASKKRNTKGPIVEFEPGIFRVVIQRAHHKANPLIFHLNIDKEFIVIVQIFNLDFSPKTSIS